MRRWLWPYAILAAVLSSIALASLVFAGLEQGMDRLDTRITVANAVVIEPSMRFLFSLVEAIAPFELPNWLKELYAVLALVAFVGLMLCALMGLLLMPVFYALYWRARSGGAG